MVIAGKYPFKNGAEVIETNFPELLREVERAVAAVDATKCKTKASKEKTMSGKMLYSPRRLNEAFTDAFMSIGGWSKHKVKCDYPTTYYMPGYQPRILKKGAFREIDFVKDKLGVEVQFGKYAFMVYNVCAKMTIFHNLGYIDAGIEIVPVKQFADEMSTGVSYFEQFVWDLENRGIADIDIPVLVIGVDVAYPTKGATQETLAVPK